MKRVCRKPWRTRFTGKLSPFGREMIEKQRIRYHFNLKNKQMEVYARRAFKKGVEYPVDNLLQQLESRLDNLVWRVGLAPTMAGARHFVKEGHIQWRTGDMKEWRTVNVPSLRLKVGDTFRVRDSKNSQNYGKLNQEDEGPVEVPEHITWDRDTMSGSYNAVCDRQDFGLNVEERFVINWYTGQGKYLKSALRIRHIRYQPGTSRIIKKSYNGGRTRPTPENIMNIKRGIGLNRRGRSRPPCLWGRRKPLNSPYEVSSRL
jgi:small subunit ribosomal protein S4